MIDCVPDELESKLEIFCLLDRMAPPRTVFDHSYNAALDCRPGIVYLSGR